MALDKRYNFLIDLLASEQGAGVLLYFSLAAKLRERFSLAKPLRIKTLN